MIDWLKNLLIIAIKNNTIERKKPGSYFNSNEQSLIANEIQAWGTQIYWALKTSSQEPKQEVWVQLITAFYNQLFYLHETWEW